MNIQDYIAKLDRIFNSPLVDYHNDHDTLTQGDWAFQLHTKIDSNGLHIDSLPVQVIAHVTYKKEHISSWGAGDTKDNTELVRWWATKRAQALDNAFNQHRQLEKEGKTLWAAK